MDVLILSIGFRPNIGGLETHLTDLTEELRKKIKVMVVTLSPITTNVKARVVEKEKNLLIWRVPWYGRGLFYKLLSSPVLEFFYLIPPLTIGLLIALIKYPSIKVIHAQGLSGVIPAGILGKLFNKKVIASTHFVYNFKDDFFARFSKWSYNLADRILCVSVKSGQEMKKAGISEKKIGRCAYWVNLDIFRPVEKIKAKKKIGWPDRFSVMFIGRLIKEKGIRELLDSIPLLSKNIEIYIVGDGPLRELVLESERKNENLHFLGKINNEDTPIYYSAADLVVVPSYNETLGRVSMESFGCGTPVVASSGGGMKEVVDDSVGLLINVDKNEIAMAINKLYKDPKIYGRLERNTRPHVMKYFSSKNSKIFMKEYGF